jgi:hypothetical protein
VKSLRAHPSHRQAALAHGFDRLPQLLANGLGEIQGDEGSNRLPRR